jgi:hypothetical protein
VLAATAIRIARGDSSEYAPIAPAVTVGGREIRTDAPPSGIVLRRNLGLLTVPALDGKLVHQAKEHLFETRATITPNGDYLLMFPDGQHYGGKPGKVNMMLAYRSSDRGQTWQGPAEPFKIDYSQHGFIPLIPCGTKRIYAFGTQPIDGMREDRENCPIGYRWSDDDGRTWSHAELIKPVNNPTFLGMSVMRMCETPRRTWLLGSHEGDWKVKPLSTRQYVLRSEDRGKTWTVLPSARPNGWYVKHFNRMDEGRPISIGGDNIFLMTRTAEGHLWGAWSSDDGRTWTDPKPTPLIHPDAPPMLFFLPDGKTLAAFHHNRYSDKNYTGLDSRKPEVMKDRSELWVSFSKDGGRSWTAPGFVLANAFTETEDRPFYNYQCSYMDAFADGDTMHLFLPHRWRRALHLTIRAADLLKCRGLA